jgi:uncharacterized repeat protein (TIGR03803 family)
MRTRSVGSRFAPAMLVVAIFVMTAAAQAQTFSVIYNFGTVKDDAAHPTNSGIIAQGRDGNLYSTANGGTPGAAGQVGYGAMFKFTPGGAETTLYDFGAAGAGPWGGLTLGADGNFYGTSIGGGSVDQGTVFQITPDGTETVLHIFGVATGDGIFPYAPPIEGRDGNFYGTTQAGGANTGYGAVYKMTVSGGVGKITILHSFDSTDGYYPYGPLVQGSDGNFYGVTAQGGTMTYGTVFKITPSGKLTTIYNFDGTHGASPYGPLVQGSDGDFYGTAYSNGANGTGTIYKITTAGQITVLHNFKQGTDGGYPFAGLIQATDGNFYGTAYDGGTKTWGTVYRISPTKPYPFKTLYNFDLETGGFPETTLIQHTNGIIYGDTELGGTGAAGPCTKHACGVIFSVDIGAAPFVTLVTPAAKVGTSIDVLGQDFKTATKVTFNGVSASFTVLTETHLAAIVPADATAGKVTVETTSGALTSNKDFWPIPQLTSFMPGSGKVGSSVTITGVSLKQATQITFDGVAATAFKVKSDTNITATVPTGAMTGKIAITTPSGTATSATNFTITP